MSDLKELDWAKMGNQIPGIVQDASTGQVLMLAYLNQESLEKTLSTQRVTFFSRSKGRLWEKGETSGNFLKLVSLEQDCDGDALLIKAEPQGPTCHLGTTSCFAGDAEPEIGFLGQLSSLIEARFKDRPEGSYTTKLIDRGVDRMAQKVGEEGVEVVIAAKNDDNNALAGEAADLVFHLLVLLRAKGMGLKDVVKVLRERRKP